MTLQKNIYAALFPYVKQEEANQPVIDIPNEDAPKGHMNFGAENPQPEMPQPTPTPQVSNDEPINYGYGRVFDPEPPPTPQWKPQEINLNLTKKRSFDDEYKDTEQAYIDAVRAEKPKMPAWKNAVLAAAFVANKAFNPQDQTEFKTAGELAYQKNVEDKYSKLAPLKGLRDAKMAEQWKRAQIENTRADNQRADKALEEKNSLSWAKLFEQSEFQNWKMQNGDSKLSDEANFRKWKIERGDKDANDREGWRKWQIEAKKADQELRRQGFDTQLNVARITANSRENVANITQAGANARNAATIAATIAANKEKFNFLMQQKASALAAGDARKAQEVELQIANGKVKAKAAGLSDEDIKQIFGEN